MKSLVLLLSLAMAVLAQEPRDPYQQVTYNIMDNDEVCATFTLAAQFTVAYLKPEGQTNVTVNVEINLPPLTGSNTTVDLARSVCPSNSTGESQTTLFVEFANDQEFEMVVGEDLNATTKVEPTAWQVNLIRFRYNLDDPYYFPDSIDKGMYTASLTDPSLINIKATNGQLFQCNAETTEELDRVGGAPVQFKYKDMLLNPFNTTSGGTRAECTADQSSSDKTVPIAVGASLGALLVIVFLAYLIGRSMRRRGDYQKV